MAKPCGYKDSPCLSCLRSKNPDECEDKTCFDWIGWFIHSWATLQDNLLPYYKEDEEDGK